MKRVLVSCMCVAATALLATFAGAQSVPTARPALAEPSLSPTGEEVAFVSGGDIWTAPSGGGTASLLVTHGATEGRPLWSPDGSQIAFTSTRNGAANIYVLQLGSNELRRLTWSDAVEQLDAWSADSKWLYFSSNAGDVARQTDVYRVAATGGTPMPVSSERYLNEFNAAPSPDGSRIALMAKGMSNVQWWRNGHSHIDEAELWLATPGVNASYQKLLDASSKRLWPMWARDGRSLYFMSDEGGAENLWSLQLAEGAKPQRLTSFTDGRVLFPSLSANASAIVFERDFGLWKLDLSSNRAAPIAVALRGSPAGASERRVSELRFDAMAVSPDGKKVAVISHGEVFASSAEDGGAAQRITQTAGAESDLVWSRDSQKLAYVSERGVASQIMEFDFRTQAEKALTQATDVDAAPVYAPDGKSLAYAHGMNELRVITFAAGKTPASDNVIYSGALDRSDNSRAAWSPDGKWLAFGVTDRKSFRNVWVAPSAGGEAKPISFLANGIAGDVIAWSPNGAYLLFDTTQRSEPSRIVRIDLAPHTPKYREDTFRDLFEKPPGETPAETAGAAEKEKPRTAAAKPEPAKRAPVKVTIVFEGIRERATFLPLGFPADSPSISPDGKTLVFHADVGDQPNLFTYSLDELDDDAGAPKQITNGARRKGSVSFSPDSKTMFYLDGGGVRSTPLDSAKPKTIAVTADMTVRFDEERSVVFNQTWSTLNRFFYDQAFHGKDWTALRSKFAPYANGAKTPDELRRIVNLMIGELDASHSGINPPREGFGSPPAPRIGDLGLRFDAAAYEAGKGLVVSEVITLGPAFVEGSIKPGDVLTAIDGLPLAKDTNLNSHLLDRAGKRTVVTVSTAGKSRQAILSPVAAPTAAGLLYRQWVNSKRAYVEKASGGRLGYVHILDMSEASLNQLYIDLDAQNQNRDGVVIDVRNNNGGFVNGYVLDVFTRRNFLTMTPRGLFSVPSRQTLGQRALGLPTVLVTNESSLSDAEDFTEGYRSLGLGKVVGAPTAGWIIYTGAQQLIDGSSVRVPSIRIQGADGADMEDNPRPVDVTVLRKLGEDRAGIDSQLDTAVRELLGSMPQKPS